ncbi:inositol 2-dehydrogenase [Sporosarcina sp. Marseille-Q4063]|uniref:inositol 2-dehydrogenase n=1 Tax=Sporosarcina sp. Marseille-Q4063 TaxID=2810514 RepID=UPI001BAFED98|nr:inositol 2-dehydrogenase [Sporosarcina sp. Marseille-Q4063]QUW21440.1 inositol 2-dehydrogenase [Sporosarcina sp. Marseille-Q4063]
MNKVTVGIIGAGRIGQLHANNILGSTKFHLKAIADVAIEHLKGTNFEQYVPVITNRWEDLTEDPEIDAIFICTPTSTHVRLITEIAKSGKHIFCEKPISFNIKETEKALEVVREANVKFQIGFNRRFDKHFRKVFDIVRAGKVGTPHIIKITSRDPEAPSENYIEHSGGMFMDMTIHDFDMIRYLSGNEVVEVSVKAANLIDPKFARYNDVDTAIITLTFADGSLGVIDNSRQAVYGYDQRIEVFGNEGVVSAENERYTNVQLSTKESVSIDHPKHFFLDRYKDAFIEEINEFATAILEDQPISCTGEDGIKAELIALAAQISHKEGRSVSLSEMIPKQTIV